MHRFNEIHVTLIEIALIVDNLHRLYADRQPTVNQVDDMLRRVGAGGVIDNPHREGFMQIPIPSETLPPAEFSPKYPTLPATG